MKQNFRFEAISLETGFSNQKASLEKLEDFVQKHLSAICQEFDVKIYPSYTESHSYDPLTELPVVGCALTLIFRSRHIDDEDYLNLYQIVTAYYLMLRRLDNLKIELLVS
jgi:hypothetical protein